MAITATAYAFINTFDRERESSLFVLLLQAVGYIIYITYLRGYVPRSKCVQMGSNERRRIKIKPMKKPYVSDLYTNSAITNLVYAYMSLAYYDFWLDT